MSTRGVAEEATAAAEHYRAATGVGCLALAPDGRPLPRLAPGEEVDDPHAPAEVPREETPAGCSLCAAFSQDFFRKPRSAQEGRWKADPCAGIQRFGISQAERFGGSYLFFCPRNLAHWSAPVRVEGVTVAALVGGPVLLVSHDDYLSEDLGKSGNLAPAELAELRSILAGIPYIDTARARSLAEVLLLEAQAVAFRLGGEAPRGEARSFGPVHSEAGRRPRYPIAVERRLLSLIAKGDLEGSRAALNDLLGFIFFHCDHELSIVKLRVLELAALLSRSAIEGGAPIEDILALNDQYLSRLQDARSVYDLSADLAVLLTHFVELVFSLKTVKNADLVQKAVRYILKHYTKPLSLEDVAFHVGLSVSHFSRLFKEGTGDTFITFLTRTRLREGQELLGDPSIPLAEIGPRVGFEDQSYFTRVFKKRTGLSPGRYRKRRGLPEATPRIDESDIEIHE